MQSNGWGCTDYFLSTVLFLGLIKIKDAIFKNSISEIIIFLPFSFSEGYCPMKRFVLFQVHLLIGCDRKSPSKLFQELVIPMVRTSPDMMKLTRIRSPSLSTPHLFHFYNSFWLNWIHYSGRQGPLNSLRKVRNMFLLGFFFLNEAL